jgi:hypothetical protein
MGVFIPDADPTTTTDSLNKDTDGGSVPDGEEDTNHNGRVDSGERDPLDFRDDVPPPSVPTVNHWGTVAMITLFAGLLVWTMRRGQTISLKG